MDVSKAVLFCEVCYRRAVDSRPSDWQAIDFLPRVEWVPAMPFVDTTMAIDPPLTFCGTECAMEYFLRIAKLVVREALRERITEEVA